VVAGGGSSVIMAWHEWRVSSSNDSIAHNKTAIISQRAREKLMAAYQRMVNIAKTLDKRQQQHNSCAAAYQYGIRHGNGVASKMAKTSNNQ